jgi:hypothetical protein
LLDVLNRHFFWNNCIYKTIIGVCFCKWIQNWRCGNSPLCKILDAIIVLYATIVQIVPSFSWTAFVTSSNLRFVLHYKFQDTLITPLLPHKSCSLVKLNLVALLFK